MSEEQNACPERTGLEQLTVDLCNYVNAVEDCQLYGMFLMHPFADMTDFVHSLPTANRTVLQCIVELAHLCADCPRCEALIAYSIGEIELDKALEIAAEEGERCEKMRRMLDDENADEDHGPEETKTEAAKNEDEGESDTVLRDD